MKGVELSRRLYVDAVRPLLDLPHAAALIGPGSEVLGFDTERSTDHDWGPRLQVFVTAHGSAIRELPAERLPPSIAGYPTSMVEPAVVVAELGDWLTGLIGTNPLSGMSIRDWLATPTQHLAEVTQGAVFHDDVGSAVVAARIVRDLMRLCLLLHRRYPPYSKWLGTAFARLPGITGLHSTLSAVMRASSWQDRETHLVYAYETVADLHNHSGLTAPLNPATRLFHDRPFRVPGTERFVVALRAGITDPAVLSLPLTGAVDQFADSTDVLAHGTRPRMLTAGLYPQGRPICRE